MSAFASTSHGAGWAARPGCCLPRKEREPARGPPVDVWRGIALSKMFAERGQVLFEVIAAEIVAVSTESGYEFWVSAERRR
jgi:hypothetical protein